jgi:class 3 adenylate cyclase
MVELPTGTVTFLFTDIEGSTRLLKQFGALSQRPFSLLVDALRELGYPTRLEVVDDAESSRSSTAPA